MAILSSVDSLTATELARLRRLAADTIRGLAMDAVQKANSGHPGMPMGMADAAVAVSQAQSGRSLYAGDVDQREHLRLATKRLRELAATVGPELGSPDWQRKREIIRTVVQRINIDIDVIKIIFRVPQNTRGSDSDAVAITVPRLSKRFRYSAC